MQCIMILMPCMASPLRPIFISIFLNITKVLTAWITVLETYLTLG